MRAARAGFTLIEILVVMVLVGIIATIGFPRFFFYREPQAEWPAILDEVNNLVLFTRQEAISNQSVYRLVFRRHPQGHDEVLVQKESRDPEKRNQLRYLDVTSLYLSTHYKLPESVSLRALFHGSDEKLSKNKGEGYCYVIPNGLVQDVMIHLSRKKDRGELKGTLKMAPFFGKFEFIDGFAKPGR